MNIPQRKSGDIETLAGFIDRWFDKHVFYKTPELAKAILKFQRSKPREAEVPNDNP